MVFETLVAAPILPLDAQAAVNALFENGLGTVTEFIMLIIVIGLTFGAIVMLGKAGGAILSDKGERSRTASDYAVKSLALIAIAAVVGAGPEVLSALGMQTADHFSAINVFTG